MTGLGEFSTHALAFEQNPFHALQEPVVFERLGEGREARVLAEQDERGAPLVRTTSKYVLAPQDFTGEHHLLAASIQAATSLDAGFNNALIERYSPTYSKMGAHSDQALDLAPDSSIAIFSCYRDPELPPRTLVVKSKETGEVFERDLAHQSAVLFTVAANQRYTHKIILRRDGRADRADDSELDWLGVTLRRSKTFIQHRDGCGYFENGRPLLLANDADEDLFYRLRGKENRETQFCYPEMDFTLSKGDLP